MSALVLEINPACEDLTPEVKSSRGSIVFTPPVGEDYWLFRVRLSAKQAILGFPKFSTIGIGFAKELDWNTNLPATCDANQIFNHIKHNKGSKAIKDEDCIAAIELVRAHALKFLALVRDGRSA